MSDPIKTFLASPAFGVVGASSNRNKFGNKVLRCYLQHQMKAYPVNPNEPEIEGLKTFANVLELPLDVESISIITPPIRTERIVEEAIKKKIKNIWMQPGAESDKAVKRCLENNINIIYGGPCLLVELGYMD